MTKMKNLKLFQLSETEMDEREMKQYRGGNNCGCGCHNTTKARNYDANWSGNKYTEQGCIICSWEMACPDDGGNCEAGVYGGDKAPGMP